MKKDFKAIFRKAAPWLLGGAVAVGISSIIYFSQSKTNMATKTFTITIIIAPQMNVTIIRFGTKMLTLDEIQALKTSANPPTWKGDISYTTFVSTIESVEIAGVGNFPQAGSFNVECNGKKLFPTDQKLITDSKGKFRFLKKSVKIPS